MSPLTPLQMQMMLHYYTTAGPYSDKDSHHANSPAVIMQRDELVRMDMLHREPNIAAGYSLTARGCKYIYMLKETPLPIEVNRPEWIDPRTMEPL